MERRFTRFKKESLYQDLRQRVLQAFLDISIASLLASKNDMTGYEIVLYLHQKHGILYSPGTIYPILRRMEKKELIKSRISGRGKPYVLTEIGKRWFEFVSKEIPGVLKKIVS